MKIRLLLLLTLLSFVGFAQETPPTPGANFKQLSTSQFWITLPDSAIWQYKGTTYGWQQVAKNSDLDILKSKSVQPWTSSPTPLNGYRSHIIGGIEYLFRSKIDGNISEPSLNTEAGAWTRRNDFGPVPSYSVSITYSIGELARTSPASKTYESKIAGNLGNTPTDGVTDGNWKYIGGYNGPWDSLGGYGLGDVVIDASDSNRRYVSNKNGNDEPLSDHAVGSDWQLIGIKPSDVSVPDATTTVKGKVKLAGDLSGTADLPTVPGLATKANLLGGNVMTGIQRSNQFIVRSGNAAGSHNLISLYPFENNGNTTYGRIQIGKANTDGTGGYSSNTLSSSGGSGDYFNTMPPKDGALATTSDISDLSVLKTDRGQANGVATLDAQGKVPLSQINDALIGSVNYKGTYNVATNTPALPAIDPSNKGWYYIITDNTVIVGLDTLHSQDWVISNGIQWGYIKQNKAETDPIFTAAKSGLAKIDGSNATAGSNWNINAATATLAANSTLLNGKSFNYAQFTSSSEIDGILANNTGGIVSAFSKGAMQSYLNIQSGGETLQSVMARGNTVDGTSNDIMRFRPNSNDNSKFGFYYTTGSNVAEYYMYDNSGNQAVKIANNGVSYLNGGNVGIGTTSPTAKLDVNGGLIVRGSYSGYGGSELTLSGAGSDNAISTLGAGSQVMSFDHRGASNTGLFRWRNGTGAATTLMTLSESGNLSISGKITASTAIVGTTTIGGNTSTLEGQGTNTILRPAGLGSVYFQDNAATVNWGFINADGWNGDVNGGTGVFAGSVTASGGFFDTSDIRLKNVINKTFDVSSIKAIVYKWKDKRDTLTHYGFSAQEIQKVMPDAVNTDKNGKLSVNYTEVLVAMVEYLRNKVVNLEYNARSLEARYADQEYINEELYKRLEKLEAKQTLRMSNKGETLNSSGSQGIKGGKKHE